MRILSRLSPRRDISFARSKVRGVIRRMLLGYRRRRPLKERSALRQNRLKGIHIILRHLPRPSSDSRKLYADERARIRAKIPAGNQVAGRRLVVDLSRRGKSEVELRREVQMEVEVFLCWPISLRSGTRWDH